jgi:hypothetical protein
MGAVLAQIVARRIQQVGLALSMEPGRSDQRLIGGTLEGLE